MMLFSGLDVYRVRLDFFLFGKPERKRRLRTPSVYDTHRGMSSPFFFFAHPPPVPPYPPPRALLLHTHLPSFPLISIGQVLHDAFFKHQTKPPLTSPGDLYYEGKEFEAKNQEHKPGNVSADLREVRFFFRRAKVLGFRF